MASEEMEFPLQQLQKQIDFLVELDKLKSIHRRTKPVGSERYENSAEHSWQLAIMAMVLADYANQPIDVTRVIQMVLVHDIVEIDADDTFVYDLAARQNKAAIEQAAAVRIFGILQEAQRDRLMGLWEEYEARETPEAQFAYALDRFMPLLQNYHNRGGSWQENGITQQQVESVCATIGDGATELWNFAKALIDDAVAQGYLQK